MTKNIKNQAKLLALLLSVSFMVLNCDTEAIDTEQQQTIQKTNPIPDFDKITTLKAGVNKRVKAYNKTNRHKNLFIEQYGNLDGKNAVTIKFPSITPDFMVVVPFKKTKDIDSPPLFIGYYKNGVETYKIVRNKAYDKPNIKKEEQAFLENLELLFKLTYNGKNTVKNNNAAHLRSSNCRDNVLYHDYENCTIAYVDSCTGLIRIVSSLGKGEMCGGELDEVIITGDDDEDGKDTGNEEDDDPTDWDPPTNNEDNEDDCIEFDCEDGYGTEPDETACDPGYVKDSNGNCVEDSFVEGCPFGYIKDDKGNCVNNPVLGADCRSFEFAQPAGALQKGCAVENFDHTFYTFGVRSNGSPYYGTIDINTKIIYFTMPNWMTNGKAANLTAQAVTNSIKAADIYFFNNPDITKFKLAEVFNEALRSQLALVGGSFSFTIEPFPVKNPVPYITSVLGISNPYDCE